MKKLIVFLLLIILPLYLSACEMVSSDEVVFGKYCEEFPNDEGCQNDGIPSGLDINDGESCLEGFILQDNVCVVVTLDDVECDLGFYEENGNCLPNQQNDLCEGDLILNNGSCVESCELPIDDINYYPCFRECNVEFSCTYHKLVLAESNSYFESFVMWVKSTPMTDSSEFELHYSLKGESETIVSSGGYKLWCNYELETCEYLNKAHFYVTNTTGDIRLQFEFWFDENWYTEVHDMYYEVWNSDTLKDDRIDLDVQVFYLEDIEGVEE